jgi:hypothetical protein
VVGFAHYRPIISVDGTFLTGKYKGTLMVVIGITVENHLPLHAFVLVEVENNESWSWFLNLVNKEVLGSGKSICMILDHHCGLLNNANEPLGVPSPYTQLVYMSFCHKHLEEATEQGSY